MAAPTFVSENETVFSNKTKPKTVSQTSAVDDVILAMFGLEENTMTTATDPTASGTLSWSQYENQGASGRGRVGIWGAAGIDAAGWTLTGTHGGDTSILDKWWGFNALRFSGASLTNAAHASRNGASVVGTIGITTTAANSAIAVVTVDWSGVNNATRDWASASAGAGTELTYYNGASHYTVYIGYYADAGAAGAKTVGCLVGVGGATTLGGHSIAAIEIKSGVITPPPAGDRSALLMGLPYQLGDQSAGAGPPAFDPKRSSMLLSSF